MNIMEINKINNREEKRLETYAGKLMNKDDIKVQIDRDINYGFTNGSFVIRGMSKFEYNRILNAVYNNSNIDSDSFVTRKCEQK